MFGTSADDVWAMGWVPARGRSEPRIVHWDGDSWKPVASPTPGRQPYLDDVAATSASDAWIVGSTTPGIYTQTMILHWDRTSWSRVSSPSPGSDSELSGVAAIAHDDAWAVGDAYNPTSDDDQTLILRWDGIAWNRLPSPRPRPRRDVVGRCRGLTRQRLGGRQLRLPTRPLLDRAESDSALEREVLEASAQPESPDPERGRAR